MTRPATRSSSKSFYRTLSGLASQEQKARLQRIFWVYLTNNFSIRTLNDFKSVEPRLACRLIPMTLDNYARVTDFREQGRVAQYRSKLDNHELGFFAEHDGKMVGSIWATINRTDRKVVVRNYMKLLPNEAIIHDGVASDQFRGMRIGPYMVSQILTTLIKDHGISKVVWDVHFMNQASMRMLEKLGLRRERRVVSVCSFGKLILQFLV